MDEFRASIGEINRIDEGLMILDSREEALLRELEFVQQEREALRACRHLATASLAPVHRLPHELLSAIFLQGTEGEDGDEESHHFPVLVSQVSRRWRDVAIGDPSLWRRINLASHTFESLRLRLTRSKNMTLDIWASYGPYESPEYIAESMNMIRVHTERWRSLSLVFCGITPIRDLLDVSRRCRGVAGKLQYLSITVDRHGLQLSYPPVDIPLVMPRLRCLKLDGLDLEWKRVNTVTELIISSLPPLASHKHWEQMSTLKSLTLTLDVDFLLDVTPQFDHVCLPGLEELTVTKVSLGSILQIPMPSLRTLRVEKGRGVSTLSWEFTHRTNYYPLPDLQTFIFGSNPVSPTPFIIRILKLMPELVTLDFNGWVPSDDFFYKWATSSISRDPFDWICPKLKNLTIHGAERDPSDAVNMFVQSRSGPRGQLPLPLHGWSLELNPRWAQYGFEQYVSDDESEYSSDVSGGI